MSKIGDRIPVIDAIDKVTGSLKYGSDYKVPGMLYGAILRSPCAHARIIKIDASKARKVPGVRTVITGPDEDLPFYTSVVGETHRDERLLVKDRVRYIGDEVAAIAATDEAIAREALKLIEVEYEELPAVFNPIEAMAEGAPLLHESFPRNIIRTLTIRHGDAEKAFRESDAVVEATFKTPVVNHAYLEPNTSIAEWDAHGRLTLLIPTQSATIARIIYANALGIPRDKIRIIQTPMGGAFGAKLDYKLHPICAVLARHANAPVKMTNTRRDEFIAALPRVPMSITMKVGCKKDGTLTAKQATVIANAGAYLNYAGPGIILAASTRHDNLYRLKNISTDGYLVHTNTLTTGAFRGFGCPQSFFALESLIDMLAHEINMDPAEFRLTNASQPGDITPHEWRLGSCGLTESIQRSAEKAEWSTKRKTYPAKRTDHFAYGIGMACCLHVSGNRTIFPYFDGASARVRIDQEGGVVLQVGEPDLGQGANTTFAQITSNELGIPIESIKIQQIDTDVSPHGLGTFADRVTTLGGNAVLRAAVDARRILLEAVARKLRVPASTLRLKAAQVFSADSPEPKMSFKDAAQLASYEMAGATVVGHGHFMPPDVVPVDPETKVGNISCAYPFVAQIAEVEVNLTTGAVKVLSLTAAHDLGKTLNPLLAEGQVQGAVAQGMGFALMEEVILDRGKVLTQNFKKYKVPRAKDMPPINTIFVETSDPNGPYGAKGLAEPALTPIAPAIANAIYHAIGVRVMELPIKPEKIREGLKMAAAAH